jgi:hypothetical protein
MCSAALSFDRVGEKIAAKAGRVEGTNDQPGPATSMRPLQTALVASSR